MELVGFFLLIVLAVNSANSQCQKQEQLGPIIDKTTSNVLYSYPDNIIYLNLEDPATCVGYVYNITFCYLKLKKKSELNSGNFSIWEPGSTPNSYKKIMDSSSKIQDYNDGCDDDSFDLIYKNKEDGAQRLYCRKRCFSEPITVKPGYVFGFEAFSYASNDAVIIAEEVDQSIGLCLSSGNILNSDEIIQFSCSEDDSLINKTLLLQAVVYPIYCSLLSPPGNGSINSTDNSYMSVVSFGCDEYYEISFPLILKCQENGWNTEAGGQWNKYMPLCTFNYCFDPGLVNNGTRNTSKTSISDSGGSALFINESVLKYECDTGYRLNGASEIQCFEGSWSHQIPTCILITCEVPDSPDNGYLLYYRRGTNSSSYYKHRTYRHGTYSINETIAFNCYRGYTLSNIYPLLCLSNGSWNDSVPKCIATTDQIPITTTSSTYLVTTNLIHTTTAGGATVDNNSDSVSSELYGFLIVVFIAAAFIILFGTVCLLLVMLARKRSANQKSLDSLKEKLLDRSDLNTSATDDMSPAGVNMPMEFCVATPNGMTYVRGQPMPVTAFLPMSRQSFPLQQSPPSSGLTTPKYVSTYFSPSVYQHYEMSSNPLLQELEQSLKSENCYWTPAEVEDELYLQLDTIKVNTILSTQLRLFEEIGSGEFATVSKGLLIMEDADKKEVDVAVKTPKNLLLDHDEKVHFLREAAIMGQFHHSNVLKLLGVVVDKPETIMVVVEFMEKGDLLNYLQTLKSIDAKEKLPFQLLGFCRQICLGMTYLSGKGFIHRDLAARNILVSENDICKIADFGMSRNLEEESYYLVHEGAVIPVKWTAPEAIKERKYSTASDVWSYGCVLYEIWSLGCKPFKSETTVNAMKILKKGQRLTPPPGCPRRFYELMIQTWNPNPKRRPTFNDIMLSLLSSDEDILVVPEEASATHPEASKLGANLQAGVCMYQDLQETYLIKN